MAITRPFYHTTSLGGDERSARPSHDPVRAAMRVVPPVFEAIKELDEARRPQRLLSHETDDGRAFNCAYFADGAALAAYKAWYMAEAVAPSGSLHHESTRAYEDPALMPKSEQEWLWGAGQQVLSDTRSASGHQLGQGTRYSKYRFVDGAARAEAERVALTPEFEERVAAGMRAAGVDYYGGRLVMLDESGEGWISSSDFGSLDDARRGAGVVDTLLRPELENWFASRETIVGSIASTWLVTLPWEFYT